jgi:hypothetical protein|tara:strand:+ start:1281 stop:1922 length:642 start_codon:yes stop_codon:yes gene_type:complete
MSKEIKLKQIVENFMVGGVVNKPAFSNLDMFKTKISTEDVNSDIRLSSLMPEDHEEGHEIDEEQFLEDVRNFGSLGKQIYRENDIRAVAQKLSEIAKTAKTHTLRETEEWFDKITINRNMKDLGSLSGQFSKIANEAQGLQERMSALYEDMGHIIGRYYEINEETGDKAEYEKFFNGALKKFGVGSPDELGDEAKAKFFNYVDKNWQGDNEND